MGLFDTITLEGVSLPDTPGLSKRNLKNKDWQSRSLDPGMDHYIVKADKKLYKVEYKQVKLTEEEYAKAVKKLDKYKNSKFYEFWVESAKYRSEIDKYIDMDYHGMVEISGSVKDCFLRYLLKFTDGFLVNIRIIEIS